MRTLALSALLLAPAAAAPFSVSPTLSSSGVLLANTPSLTSLWGHADPGASVAIALGYPGAPAVAPALTGSDGVWRAVLPSLPILSIPFNISLSSAGSPEIVLTDMLAGVVLLCSGQSNLQLSIAMALNASAEVAALDAFGATVRVMYTAGASSAEPLADLPSAPQLPWQRISAAGAGRAGWGGFSATCWYTGRELWRALGAGAVPVGLVESAVGGTAIRQWAPVEALARCPQPYNSPKPYGTAPYAHSTLYNAQIAPFGTGPTRFSAVLWDQAESDSFPQTPQEYYGCQGPAMVNAWRELLQASLLPFVFQHLQPYSADYLEVLRQSQLAMLALPATGFGSAMDLGDPSSPLGAVHFRNKQEGAARLALAIRALWGDAEAAQVYPPPQFLSQATWLANSSSSSSSSGTPGTAVYTVDVAFFRPGLRGGRGAPLPLTLTPPPACPASSNCTCLSIVTSAGALIPATNATLTPDGLGLRLVGEGPAGDYPVGSAYAWSFWPLPVLYGPGGLPVLPWLQSNVSGGVCAGARGGEKCRLTTPATRP